MIRRMQNLLVALAALGSACAVPFDDKPVTEPDAAVDLDSPAPDARVYPNPCEAIWAGQPRDTSVGEIRISGIGMTLVQQPYTAADGVSTWTQVAFFDVTGADRIGAYGYYEVTPGPHECLFFPAVEERTPASGEP